MKHTQSTAQLISALQGARGIDLEKIFASAIEVAVLNYTTGADIVQRVSIPAEFAGPLVDGLIKSLEMTLARRVESLGRELEASKKLLKGTGVVSK